MLPDKSDKRWKLLVQGDINHSFKSVPGSMLISRLNRQVKNNNSPEIIEQCIIEAYEFFQKYEIILTDDINAIFK